MCAKQATSSPEISTSSPLQELEVFLALICLSLTLFGFMWVFSPRWSTDRPLPRYTLCVSEYSAEYQLLARNCP